MKQASIPPFRVPQHRLLFKRFLRRLCQENALISSHSSGLILSDGRLSGRGSLLLSSAAPRSSEALSLWEGLTEDSRRCSPSPQHRESGGGERTQTRLAGRAFAGLESCTVRGRRGCWNSAVSVESAARLYKAGAALREGLEEKRRNVRAWYTLMQRGISRISSRRLGEIFCCVRSPSEAVWTLKPTVVMHISYFICCHINSAFAFKRNWNAVA